MNINFDRQMVELGVSLPDELAKVSALRQALYSDPETQTPEDALLAGKVTDKNAQKWLVDVAQARLANDAIREIRHNIASTLDKLTRRAIRVSAPSILLSLREPFDLAVAQLEASIEVLGPNPDQRAVFNSGPISLANWEARKRAIKSLTTCRSVRVGLATAGWGPKIQSPSWYLASIPNLDALGQARTAFSKGFEGLADAGYKLRLNDPDEIAALESGAANATAAQRATEREAELAALRRDTARSIKGWKDLVGPQPVKEQWVSAEK